MKDDRKESRILIFSLALLMTALGWSEGARAEEEFIARAVSVSGKVLARAEGSGNVQMTFLKPGDKLYKGSIVNTGSNGSVKLLMTDRTVVDLGPSSLFKVNDYQLTKGQTGDRKVDLSLDYGQVRASVNEKLTSNKGKFTIRTKAATMGVRGTEFVVKAPLPAPASAGAPPPPPQVSLTVMHGKVEVADTKLAGQAPIAVTPGFQFNKSGESGGQIANLGMGEVTKIKSDAFQKDMTFAQTVTFDANSTKGNSETKSEGKTATNEPAPPPSGGGQQTLEKIVVAMEAQSAQLPPPTIGDMKLPGVFTPEIPQFRPIDQLNGRLIRLGVRICQPGQC